MNDNKTEKKERLRKEGEKKERLNETEKKERLIETEGDSEEERLNETEKKQRLETDSVVVTPPVSLPGLGLE